MPEYTTGYSIPYPSPGDPIRGSTADYLLTDLRDLAFGADSAATTAGRTAEWESVSGKPSAFPPTGHTHPISNVVGLDARLSSVESYSDSWDDAITALHTAAQ